MFLHTERIVTPTVEALGTEAPKIPDSRDGDVDEPIEELVHTIRTQRHPASDRHIRAQLESRDRRLGACDRGLLPGDDAEVLHRRFEDLRILYTLADAHVDDDLR